MNQINLDATIYEELKTKVDSLDKEKLLSELKKEAKTVDIRHRRDFESALLKLTENTTRYELRDILYEQMVSLSSIWNEHSPSEGLIGKFRAYYDGGEYEKAGRIYSKLLEQKLDYIGTINLDKGKLLPVDFEENQGVLHVNGSRLSFLDLNLEIKNKVELPGKEKIIDVLPPVKPSHNNTRGDVYNKLWLLTEDKTGSRWIVPMDIGDKKTGENRIAVDRELNDAHSLSRFQDHLLLVSKDRIFFYDQNNNWQKWIANEGEITYTEPARDKFWVGLSDGNIRILKLLVHPGARDRFKAHPDEIRSIHSSNRFVAAASKNRISVTDIESTPILVKEIESNVIQTIVLDNKSIAGLQANGILTGRDIRQGNVAWQINLGDVYDSLFSAGNRLYCRKDNGKTAIFEIPDKEKMNQSLEKQNIYVADRPIERDAKAPIGYFSEFNGRDGILEEIKKSGNSHFLIHGAPKTGKTSLLNVLSEVLASKAVCCYIDMEQLFEDVRSYDDFEKSFILKCLSQHALRLEDLQFKTNWQRFRAMTDKVRGSRNYCILCLDNFSFPSQKDAEWKAKFKGFMKDLFIYPNSLMVLTCRKKDFKQIEQYFREIEKNVSGDRRMRPLSLSIFSENEAKNAIRKLGYLDQAQVENIYNYTGGFPHLVRYFKDWNEGEEPIENYSKEIASYACETIFEFFRELSPDAYLFLATLLHKDLISREIRFTNFYHDYPLLRQLIPKFSLLKILDEISQFCDGFTAEHDDNGFSVHLREKALLFHDASKRISWLKVFVNLYDFRSHPTPKSADDVVVAFRKASKIISTEPGDPFTDSPPQTENDYFLNVKKQFKDDFYIRRVTEEGRTALGMPLVTFIVMPLKPWVTGKTLRTFGYLYNSIQELARRTRPSAIDEAVSKKFYILLFEFLGTNLSRIKDEIKGMERVSIIDAHKMKEILLDKNPLLRSSEEIFRQLNISERSPYTTAGAVQDLFFGRELEITLIRGLPENIGIFGTRTIGKTSLLLKLHRDIKDQPNWKVVALDCSGIEDEEGLLRDLAYKMEEDFDRVSDIEKFRKYVTQRAEEEDSQYLFLLDEVDGLVEYDIRHDEKIFQTFNKMCNEPLKRGDPAARFVLFGFQQMYEQMNNPESRLYNFMVFLPLKSLDMESALGLVTTPMKKIHVKWQDEEDATYLVDNCSRYPLLLQAACHELLNILDKKKEKKDIIQRKDIDQVLFGEEKLRKLCMRFYDPKKKQIYKPKRLFLKRGKPGEAEKEPFFEDIHKITILAVVNFIFVEKKEKFTLTEIQEELKTYGIVFSPGLMREIIDRLCLNGTLRMIEEPTIINLEDKEMVEKVEQVKQKIRQAGNGRTEEVVESILEKLKVEKPVIYSDSAETFLKFEYEFGVKIFPKLLVAVLDGVDNCKKELGALVKKKNWEDWVRRHS